MKLSIRSKTALTLAAILLPVVAACSETVTDPGVPGASAGAGSGSNDPGPVGTAGTSTTPPSSAGTGSVTPPPVGTTPPTGTPPPVTMMPPSTPTTPETAGPLALRRLTIREYDNTVRDLFQDTTRPAASNFPSDSESESGFLGATNLSLLYAQHYEEAAISLADAALAANRLNIPCTNPTAAQEAACAKQFIEQFGRRAFRRPVGAEELVDLQKVFTAAREIGFTFPESISHVVKAVLQFPGFLYHWEEWPQKPVAQNGSIALGSHQIAARLSYFFWETMPDADLAAAADAGQLSTPEQVKAQAERLIKDKRAESVMETFHVQWLRINNLGNLQKNTTLFPSYNDAVRLALAEELRMFTSQVLLGQGDGTLTSLLTAPYSYVNAALAPIYGVTVPGTALVRTELNPSQRSGILTQGAFLATNASPGESHPVFRGLAIWKHLLCGDMPPPPPDIPDVETATGNMTTRERYAAHSSSPCAGCHKSFDGVGFAFENYDALGMYRTVEAGKPVDATGSVTTPAGKTFAFKNAVELSTALASSEEVRWCATRQWFRYMLGRMETTSEQGSLERAYVAGAANPGYSLRDVLLTAVQSSAFRYRAVTAGEAL